MERELERFGFTGRIILKWIIKKCVGLCTELIRARTGVIGWLF
jgi:hypothetical protein